MEIIMEAVVSTVTHSAALSNITRQEYLKIIVVIYLGFS